MSLPARKELIRSVAPRYQRATRTEKQTILDEVTKATGYHRKYATALLNEDPAAEPKKRAKRRGRRRYGDEIEAVLIPLWEAAGRICSKRLVPFLPQLIRSMERHGYLELQPEIREKLLTISAATVDRLLARTRKAERKRAQSRTRSGSLLKEQVPIRTFADWDEEHVRPGFVEADLVAHCGSSVEGSFLHTLTLTDVASGWTECLALLYRDQATTLGALRVGRDRMPFRLVGLDTDNGTEFLNGLLLSYCRQEQITFTRSRAYKKNDQCRVEQKNGAIVRRFVGYDRYEGIGPCRILSELYQSVRLYVNYFQPSMKLLSKKREGAKVKKTYDEAQTPCQRLLTSDRVSQSVKDQLLRGQEALDPVALLREIDRLQDELWLLAYEPAAEQKPQDQPQDVSGSESDVVQFVKNVADATGLGGDGAPGRAPTLEEAVPSRKDRHYRSGKPKGRYHLVTRTWRTRKDPFEDVNEEIYEELRRRPHVAAKTIFLELQQRYPGKFKDGQLRTLQRRVKEWRLKQSTFVANEVNRHINPDDNTEGNTPLR